MADLPPDGRGRGRGAPSDVSQVTPAGGGEGSGVGRGRGRGGPSRLHPPRSLTPPFGGPSRGLPTLGQTDLRSVLNDFRTDILAEVSRAVTASQAASTPTVVEDQAGQPGFIGGSRTSKKSKGRRGRRRHRRGHYSSSDSDSKSSTSSATEGDQDESEHVAPNVSEGPKVIAAADDRFARVLDYNTYRLRNRATKYGTKEASKMGRTAKNMKHSFGGYPPFSGKEPLKVFSWLRKFTKACDDNGVSEGMALYAVPHFLSGDAETRYTRALPDSASTSGGCSITTYPEAINWFLETYAEPHTLALAQDKFSRAAKESDETVEAFALRLRSLSESCGNIHSEGTMKQQLIQGLPEFLRTDAFVYNDPACTYQKLVTYTAGKFKAAKDVIELAKGSSKGEDGGRRTSFIPRPPTPRPRLPAMAIGEVKATEGTDKTANHQADDKATPSPWAYEPATRRYLASRTQEGRGPLRCYVCWEAGHMAHQCPKLSEAQRENVIRARDAFLQSTRGHKKINDEAKYREQRDINRRTRIAVVQALCDGIEQSDEEEDVRRSAKSLRAMSAGPPPPSGEE